MSQSLLVRIQDSMDTLTKVQRSIAQFIIGNYDKAAYMTAAKLAECADVSEASVVRFATRLGFDGYPGLQQEMQELSRNSLTIARRIEVTAERIGDGAILSSVLGRDIDLIRDTMERASGEQFDSAVNAICAARRIYIIATRSTSALANFMRYYLSLIFEQVVIVDPSNESDMFERMMNIGREDVVIGISFPRYSSRAASAMRFASDCGADTIALTDSESSPLAERADHLLLARSDMASIVDSLVAPMSIINALVVATALRKKDELTDRFLKLESIWDEYGVYEKSDK